MPIIASAYLPLLPLHPWLSLLESLDDRELKSASNYYQDRSLPTFDIRWRQLASDVPSLPLSAVSFKTSSKLTAPPPFVHRGDESLVSACLPKRRRQLTTMLLPPTFQWRVDGRVDDVKACCVLPRGRRLDAPAPCRSVSALVAHVAPFAPTSQSEHN